MKQLDTHTVLEIIKIIRLQYNSLRNEYSDKYKDDILIDIMQDPFYEGGLKSLRKLKDHLQSYIEGQLNAAENSTGE